MRTTAFIQALLASFVLSACASGSALDLRPREAATGPVRTPLAYVVRPQATPVVDTTVQREALRRVPHGADRPGGTGTFHR
jgi:hypothetical protein